MELDAICPHCKDRLTLSALDATTTCPKCKATLLCHPTDQFLSSGTLDQCPLCGCAHLYRQKDFNRRLGIALIVAGVLAAPFTYGVSILLVTLLDFIIYRVVGEVGCCYQCHSVFRETPAIESLGPFQLQLHDHYKNRAH